MHSSVLDPIRYRLVQDTVYRITSHSLTFIYSQSHWDRRLASILKKVFNLLIETWWFQPSVSYHSLHSCVYFSYVLVTWTVFDTAHCSSRDDHNHSSSKSQGCSVNPGTPLLYSLYTTENQQFDQFTIEHLERPCCPLLDRSFPRTTGGLLLSLPIEGHPKFTLFHKLDSRVLLVH